MGKAGIIYRYYNIKTGKSYVGQTYRTLHARDLQHLGEARRHREKHSAFQNALRKYSSNDWIIGVIVENVPHYFMDSFEQYWISHFQSFGKGYNLTLGGQGTQGLYSRKGSKHTEHSKKLISKNSRSYKGQPAPYTHTKEQKLLAAEKSLGNNSRASITKWSIQWPNKPEEIYIGKSKKEYANENGFNYKGFTSLFSNKTIPSRGIFKGVIAKKL